MKTKMEFSAQGPGRVRGIPHRVLVLLQAGVQSMRTLSCEQGCHTPRDANIPAVEGCDARSVPVARDRCAVARALTRPRTTESTDDLGTASAAGGTTLAGAGEPWPWLVPLGPFPTPGVATGAPRGAPDPGPPPACTTPSSRLPLPPLPTLLPPPTGAPGFTEGLTSGMWRVPPRAHSPAPPLLLLLLPNDEGGGASLPSSSPKSSNRAVNAVRKRGTPEGPKPPPPPSPPSPKDSRPRGPGLGTEPEGPRKVATPERTTTGAEGRLTTGAGPACTTTAPTPAPALGRWRGRGGAGRGRGSTMGAGGGPGAGAHTEPGLGRGTGMDTTTGWDMESKAMGDTRPAEAKAGGGRGRSGAPGVADAPGAAPAAATAPAARAVEVAVEVAVAAAVGPAADAGAAKGDAMGAPVE